MGEEFNGSDIAFLSIWLGGFLTARLFSLLGGKWSPFAKRIGEMT
ncbi:hypothetical protein [Pontibacillus yanchengensis]|nr:hypothetical protein [Pontibacillus yanchengensis]